jgi:hypothetical protein
VVTTPTEHVTRSRSLIMKYSGKHSPIATSGPASVESVVGTWLLAPGAILCSGGYWRRASLFVVAALPFWVAYQLLQPSVRS